MNLVRRNEDIVVAAALPLVRTHETEAVAVQVETAGDEVIAAGRSLRDLLESGKLEQARLVKESSGKPAIPKVFRIEKFVPVNSFDCCNRRRV